MNQIFAIAQNTYREAVRNRIFFVLALFAMVMLFVSLALSSGSLHQEVRLMKDSGLFLTSTCCVLISIFVGVNLVYKELERKTVYTIMPKPIDRSQFLLGKYVGLAFVMLILVAVMGVLLAALLLLVGGELTPELFQAFYMAYLEVLIIIAVALFFSSFSTPFLSGLMTLGYFLVGRFVDQLVTLKVAGSGDGNEATEQVDVTVRFLANLFPDLTIFNLTEQVVYGRPVSIDYLVHGTLTAATYIALGLVLATILFARRDFV